ncbi:MAG: Hpt domain-containing protein [Oscillospiraceae bacterium]|nr:Hpt domain-containing protein [Oscillospiraceae bacterium]
MITGETVIEGLNIPNALRRLGGNSALYSRLLQSFLKGGELAALRAGILDGDAVKAGNSAHALKGTAANLSVTEIWDAAAALERSLKESGAVSAGHREALDAIEQQFSKLSALCAPYFEG